MAVMPLLCKVNELNFRQGGIRTHILLIRIKVRRALTKELASRLRLFGSAGDTLYPRRKEKLVRNNMGLHCILIYQQIDVVTLHLRSRSCRTASVDDRPYC